MSKTRKLLIALLTIISAVCLTLAGCTRNKTQFVDFEDVTIEYDLYETFDASQYLEVYDKQGNLHYANILVYDADGNEVKTLYYQFKVEKNYYKMVVTIKDDQEVIGKREIIINGVNKTPPFIMFLNMADFGVMNQPVSVPLQFDTKGASISKKLVVERYVTDKVNGEYVTDLDTQNAIVVENSSFTSEGASFTPTKPGVYKISVYAWNNNQSEAEARVISKTYSIKDNADAWGEIESFETPASLEANYHQYGLDYEYNPQRGLGRIVYVTNDAGDYLDENGDILYKKVDESATNHRIAFYKKANSQATDYTELAYYQDLATYSFYDANGNVAYTKEGCVTVKDATGADYKFNSKGATIGEEWYQEFTDKNGVTKYGVIKAQASENRYSTTQRLFHIQSTYRKNDFLKDWYVNENVDYLSVWVLIMPKTANESQTTVQAFKTVAFNTTQIPVGQWFEYKVSKAELKGGTAPTNIFAYNRTVTPGSYFTVSTDDYAKFDFYFDNFSYAKGADITFNSDSFLMGTEIELDIANAGELTKDDFKFYLNKTNAYDNDGNEIAEGYLGGSCSFNVITDAKPNNNYALIEGCKFTPAIENDYASRQYYIQALLNEQGLAKNNGEQIYASKVITVNNVQVSLSEHELGQEVTINADVPGVNNATFTYAYKQTDATDWTTLTTNKFTPTVPTSYDVKVVATVGNLTIEKTLTKDYTKEIALSVTLPEGFNKYVINQDMPIVAELEGSANLVVTVVNGSNQNVAITNNVLNVASTGEYTITATCTFNGIALNKVLEIIVVGDKNVTANFKVNGAEFDINNSAVIGDVISVGAVVDGQLTTQNVTYEVVKLDTNPANNYEITVVGGAFNAVFTGTYNIVVYYNDNSIINASEVYSLTVIANTYENARYINTFSDSESIMAAYTKGEKTTTLEGAEWYSEYQGKYGVISTLGQAYDADSNYSAFYLRSGDYTTSEEFAEAGLAKTVFGTEKSPEYGGYLLGFNSEDWDYLSIPVYVTKPEGVESDTLSIYYVDAKEGSDVIENVPYNTWYELKLDKPIIMRTFAYLGRLFNQFSNTNDKNHRNPLLLAANGTVENIYFDSMSFEKYTEYEHFGALYLEDESGNAVTKTETLMMDVANSPATFTIKAKLNKGDTGFLDVSQFKLEYYIYGGTLTRAFKDGSGNTVSYGASTIFYKDKSSKATPCSFIATNIEAGKDGYTAFKFVYEHTDGKTYIGYLMIECGFMQVPAAQ